MQFNDTLIGHKTNWVYLHSQPVEQDMWVYNIRTSLDNTFVALDMVVDGMHALFGRMGFTKRVDPTTYNNAYFKTNNDIPWYY